MIEIYDNIAIFEDVIKDDKLIDLITNKKNFLNLKRFLNRPANTSNKNLAEVDFKFLYDLSDKLCNHIIPCVNEYSKFYGHSIGTMQDWVLLKYEVGGFFGTHSDWDKFKPSSGGRSQDHDIEKRISLVYYINDNYTGGEIEFPKFDIIVKPKSNSMLVFDSSYYHRVNTVTSGTRYAIGQWFI